MKNKQIAFWLANIIYFSKTYPEYRRLKKNPIDSNVEKYVTNYTKYILKKIKVTYEILGEENLKDDSTFYVLNHGSMFDSYITYLTIKHKHSYFIAGDLKYALKIPFLGNVLKWTNAIFVDRTSLKAGMKSIKQAEEQLKRGKNLFIFPEGEITEILTQEKVAEFHAGSFKAAQKVGAPVVPITLIGSNKIHNTTSIFSKISSAHVKVVVAKPLYDFSTSDITTQEMAHKTREIILNTLEKN